MPQVHYECGTCGEVFPDGWRARDEHCQSNDHAKPLFECEKCPRWFKSQYAVEQHMVAKNHWPYRCRRCAQTFPTQESLAEHEVEYHLYCLECNRYFQSYNNIKMHLNSRAHRGRESDCPFCQRGFPTVTAVASHLETENCSKAKGLNHDQLYRFIRSKDPSGLISKNLLAWCGPVQYEVNDNSWNGDAYECYLCHREFNNVHALQQHIKSPIHQEALYHCPNRACRQDFKTLPGLFNHLESETCNFMPFEQVQDNVDDIVRGDRLITFT